MISGDKQRTRTCFRSQRHLSQQCCCSSGRQGKGKGHEASACLVNPGLVITRSQLRVTTLCALLPHSMSAQEVLIAASGWGESWWPKENAWSEGWVTFGYPKVGSFREHDQPFVHFQSLHCLTRNYAHIYIIDSCSIVCTILYRYR